MPFYPPAPRWWSTDLIPNIALNALARAAHGIDGLWKGSIADIPPNIFFPLRVVLVDFGIVSAPWREQARHVAEMSGAGVLVAPRLVAPRASRG